MFGMGFAEVLLILMVALIVLGPNKVQNLAVWLGRSMAKARKTYGQWNHLLAHDVTFDKASDKKGDGLGSDDGR